MKKLLMSVFGKPSEPPRHDAVVWTLAKQKQQAEQRLRAEGYSRKEATTIASKLFRQDAA